MVIFKMPAAGGVGACQEHTIAQAVRQVSEFPLGMRDKALAAVFSLPWMYVME